MVDTIRASIPLVNELVLPYVDQHGERKTFTVEYYEENMPRSGAQNYTSDIYAVPNRNYAWTRHHILNLAYLYQILEKIWKVNTSRSPGLVPNGRGWRQLVESG